MVTYSKKKMRNKKLSLGAALLGLGLVLAIHAISKRKRTWKNTEPPPQPIETEDGGYAEEVNEQKDEQKLLMPPTSDDFIASDRFKD